MQKAASNAEKKHCTKTRLNKINK